MDTATKAKFRFAPVNKNNVSDFEQLFESRGAPHHCWCMVWRAKGDEIKHKDKASKKKYMMGRIEDDIPVGLLAYDNEVPVAWCSIAPRETYKKLGGDTSLQNVWSLVCFFIKRDYRGQHLTSLFIQEAIQYAKQNGAKYVEAYPVEADSPGYHFMGFKPVFEQAGFQFLHMAGIRRNVMILAL